MLVVVRRGNELIHIYDRDVALKAVLSAERSPAGRLEESSYPHLAENAAQIGARAVELITSLGKPTLCKGLAKLRADGHKMPPQLERSVRALDAAASLIRHPGAAEATLERLTSWMSDPARGTPSAVRSGGGPSTAAGSEGSSSGESSRDHLHRVAEILPVRPVSHTKQKYAPVVPELKMRT